MIHADDRVLVAYVPSPKDFKFIQTEGWYRIPQKHAPKGIHAEHIAFYFGSKFGEQKWAIHFVAENLGHELATRRMLLPDEPNHPRADEIYYKIQLENLRRLNRPIPSLQWRRILFLHTTGDRFSQATEINDLFLQGDALTDRQFVALNDENGDWG